MNNIFAKFFCPNDDFIFDDFNYDYNLYFDYKKMNVKFNNNVNVILIPSRHEYETLNKDNIWYSIHQLEKIRNEFFNELDVISCIKNITRKEALTYWKLNNT